MAATGNHDAKLLQMQLEALGGDRREHIVTTRFKEEEHPVPVPPPRNVAVLSSSDADAGGQASQLSAWFSAWEHLKEDVKHERHLEDIGTGIGQSHRHKLQPALATGASQRGENSLQRSPQFRRARPAPVRPEMIRIGGRNTELPSRGAPHHASSSTRGRGRGASISLNVPIPTKSSKSQKVIEAPRRPTTVDALQRRERRSHTQVVDLCKPSDFLAFSGLAPINNKLILTKEGESLQKAKPSADLPPPASESRPAAPKTSPMHASGGTLEASSANRAAHESTDNLRPVETQQANVSPVTISPPVDRLPAAVETTYEPDLERSFTREGLLRFMPRLREQLPKDLFAQVEAFVHNGEEDDQSSGDQDVTAHKESRSVSKDSLSSTTASRAGTPTEHTRRRSSPPSQAITKTGLKSSKGADAPPRPSAPLSIMEDSANIRHLSVQSTNAAAALLSPKRPAQRAEDEAKLGKGVIVDSPSMDVQWNDPKVTGLLLESQQATLPSRSGRQSLAQSLMKQRDALIGEHVHKSRFSHTTTSLEKQFANLRISETDASQGIRPNTLEVSSSASNVPSHRKGPTLPSFLQAIQRESDPGAAARNQYSGNLEPRTSTDPTEFKPETSRREKSRSTSSSTTDPSSFPTSRITPRTGEGPKLPNFLRPGGLHSVPN